MTAAPDIFDLEDDARATQELAAAVYLLLEGGARMGLGPDEVKAALRVTAHLRDHGNEVVRIFDLCAKARQDEAQAA